MAIQKGSAVCVMGSVKDRSLGLEGLFTFQVPPVQEKLFLGVGTPPLGLIEYIIERVYHFFLSFELHKFSLKKVECHTYKS